MIQFKNLLLRRGARVLIDDANITINNGYKVGLVGENGAGKSSLIALMLGELAPDGGQINMPGNITIAHLAQEVPALDQSALDYVIDGDTEFRRIEKALETEEDPNNIGQLYMDMATIDGYTTSARASQLLHGLQFLPADCERSVKDFSGGFRMRLNLARTLMSRADLLLLDEPTNHLDLDAIIWLENWIKSLDATVLFISHDRDFLDNVSTHIIHLAQKTLKSYTGNYSDFERQRAADLALQQAHAEKQERKRAHWQSFVDRFRAKASKAPQVQSRIKALEKLSVTEGLQISTPFSFKFYEAPTCSNPMMKLESVNLGYNDSPLLRHINVSFERETRVGLIGPNGAGKSTLIQALSGDLAPLAGEVFYSSALKIGYFAQHQLDSLDMHASPYLHIQRLSPEAREKEIRSFLGGFGFGENAAETITNFSGGEKTRLALAMLIWQKPNLLLLDEPTNHLDLEMRHALVMALQNYNGALIVVSHDRHLLRTCTDSFLLVAHNKVEEYEGSLEDYEIMLKNYRRDLSKKAKEETASNKANNKSKSGKQDKTNANRVKTIETQLKKLSTEKEKLDVSLAETDLYTDSGKPRLEKLQSQQKTLLQEQKALEEEWLGLQDA